MANLLDSGARRDFGTGAVRDVAEGKGRCDLLPLKVVSDITDDGIPAEIELYIRTGDLNYLRKAIIVFAEIAFGNIWTALLETAKQYEDGAKKYGARIELDAAEAMETITQELNKCPNVSNVEIQFIAKECAGVAMRRICEREIPNLYNGNTTTAISGEKSIQSGSEITQRKDLKTPYAEKEISAQNTPACYAAGDLQKKQTYYSYKGKTINAPSAEETLIQSGQCILTMTMKQGLQEVICVVVATTESECLKNLLELCKKQLHISSNLLQMNISIESNKLVFSCSGDRNWEKGINSHVFIDSGVRHYLKWRRGDEDEPHDRAFLWNMLGAIWTHENKPELIDLPFALTISTTSPSECSSMSTKWDGMSDKELSDTICNIGLCSACNSDRRKIDCPFLVCDCSNHLEEFPDFRRIAIEYLEKEGKA